VSPYFINTPSIVGNDAYVNDMLPIVLATTEFLYISFVPVNRAIIVFVIYIGAICTSHTDYAVF
jgi:hypothetical protein